jgi:hypothetical protein
VIDKAGSKQVQLIVELDKADIDARYEQWYTVKEESINVFFEIILVLHHSAMEIVRQSLEG